MGFSKGFLARVVLWTLSGCLLVSLISGCSSLLYYPTKGQYYNPGSFGLLAEDIFFSTSEQTKIHAWLFRSSASGSSKGTVVFFHGNAENLTSHFVALSWLPKQGYNFLIFDYPGYNLSEGEPTPRSTVEAGVAAVEWVNTHLESEKESKRNVFTYGHSLGGIVSLRVVIELKKKYKTHQVQGLIVDGTFQSYKRASQTVMAKHWLTWLFQPLGYFLLSDEWAPKELDLLSPLPVLVLHGEKDKVIDFKLGQELFASLIEPKEFYPVANGHHGDLFFVDEGQHRQKMLDFLSVHLASDKGKTL